MSAHRAIPDATLAAIGPVIFLDHVGPVALPVGTEKRVPPHPHAGIETLTYLLSGSAAHRDSAGNASTVVAGEAQWMRAGRGIVHAESVGGGAEAGALIHLVHIWINLPRGHKHTTPAYRAFCAAEMPTLKFGAAQVQLLAGNLGGCRGPLETFAEPLIAHLTFAGGGTADVPIGATEFGLYVTDGQVRVDGGVALAPGHLVLFGPGDRVRLGAEGPAGALLLGGPPLDAPIVRHGPFVMNTHAEVQSALQDYLAGRMGSLSPERHGPPKH